MASQSVQATLYYLRHSHLYQTTKPYSLAFPTTEIARSNLMTEKVDDICIHDIRGSEDAFTFRKNGFAIVEMDSSMKYEDFEDSQKIDDIFSREVAQCLMQYMDASAVHVFDTRIRRRHESFPFSQVDPTLRLQPAMRVHIDGTQKAVKSLIRELHGNDAEVMLQKDFIYVNVWKPLRGPLYDFPLALCDAASVDPDHDFEFHDDVISLDQVRENIMVHFNPKHKWYYLARQEENEMLVFRQVDSQGAPGVAHTSFLNPMCPDGGPLVPRESIEARAMVYLK